MLQEITSTHAILNKKLSVIKYLIEKGCPFLGMDIMDTIIEHDKLVFLRYFINKYKMNITKENFENITKNDSIKCLTYVSKYKKLFDSFNNNDIFASSYGKCRKFLTTQLLKKQI